MENTNDQSLIHVAEIHLSYKSNVRPSQRPKVTSSRESYQILFSTWDKDKVEFVEQFKILLLNRANKVLGIVDITSGTSTATIVDPKLIFAAALKANACSIIGAHNHPSGNRTPSQADIHLTKKLIDGGKLLEIQVLDHIIVTTEGYYSFADEGLI